MNIGDQTFIGMHAMVMPGVTIGKHCVIGANAVVTESIPDYCVAAGVPAKIMKRYDKKKKKLDQNRVKGKTVNCLWQTIKHGRCKIKTNQKQAECSQI